ncbi:MAG TPA: hypothetical protein VK509_22895 [Polyangiales bacterium]|nr:hypothetical protein [Polyangiales bacterium]
MKRELERPLRELPVNTDPLAAAVRAVLAEDPTPARLERLGLRLDAALEAGTHPRLLERSDDSPSPSRGTSRSGVFKIASLVATGALIAGVVLLVREARPAPTVARPTASATAPPAKAAPATTAERASPEPVTLAPASRDQLGAHSRIRTGRKPRSEGTPATEDARPGQAAQRIEPADELELLRLAQASLPQDGQRALLHVRAHERAFPHGLLEQEREVLAITALLSLGDVAGAQRRASTFQQMFPHSAHLRRVDRLLAARNRTIVHPSENIEPTDTRTP